MIKWIAKRFSILVIGEKIVERHRREHYADKLDIDKYMIMNHM